MPKRKTLCQIVTDAPLFLIAHLIKQNKNLIMNSSQRILIGKS